MSEPAATHEPGAAVVVGATGGLGRALVERLAEGGRHAALHALARREAVWPAPVRGHRVDLTDEATIAAAAAEIGRAGPVTLVVVASGLLHAPAGPGGTALDPEKAYRSLDPGALARLFAVNATGPALVAKHFLPLMPRRGRAVFAALSARVGSIEDNRLGGWYGYRASKAALNQLLRTLAIEVARTRPDAAVVGLHPGTVATDLSRPFRPEGAGEGVFAPAEAAARLLAVLDGVGPSRSGRVIAWDGRDVPV
jgi:NAD(P)-dependent dehydrogenase (short-subunit alcohol dehydrogenase family)